MADIAVAQRLGGRGESQRRAAGPVRVGGGKRDRCSGAQTEGEVGEIVLRTGDGKILWRYALQVGTIVARRRDIDRDGSRGFRVSGETAAYYNDCECEGSNLHDAHL